MEERRDLIAFNRTMEEKKHQIQKRVNKFNPTLIGGEWKPESLMSYLRDLNNTDLGKWCENLFEDEFGYESMEGPLDIPELNVDIKVVKRAEISTAFNMHYTAQMKAAKAGLIKDINKVIYVIYLIFPDYYELVYIPHSHLKMLCPNIKIDYKITININLYRKIKEKYDFRKDFPTWDLSNMETITTLPKMGSLEKFI